MGGSKWNIGQKRPACRRKRVIVIASEGEVTEPVRATRPLFHISYFSISPYCVPPQIML